MWSLEATNQNKIRIPADDVVFSAVLRKGPTTHVGKTSRVRCTHIAEYSKNSHILFFMSILEATATESRNPEFSSDGIMGKWKLVPPKEGDVPLIVLLEVFDSVSDFVMEAIGPNNPEWVRKSYADLEESLLIKKHE
jgi:hypothetical protein